jgi:hypothetical protein
MASPEVDEDYHQNYRDVTLPLLRPQPPLGSFNVMQRCGDYSRTNQEHANWAGVGSNGWRPLENRMDSSQIELRTSGTPIADE